MANENGSKPQRLSLTDETIRKIRKHLTRKADGSFEVCDTHERRMRATDFEIMIVADATTGEVSVHASASVSCGHSKKPCTDSRTITVANAAGLDPKIVKILSLVEPDEDEDKEDAA